MTARKPDASGVPRQDGIKGLFAWFSLDQTTAAEVRSEIWARGQGASDARLTGRSAS